MTVGPASYRYKDHPPRPGNEDPTVDMEHVNGTKWVISRSGQLLVFDPSDATAVDGYVTVPAEAPSQDWRVAHMTSGSLISTGVRSLLGVDEDQVLWSRSTSRTAEEWRRVDVAPAPVTAIAMDANGVIWLTDTSHRLWARTSLWRPWVQVGRANNVVALAATEQRTNSGTLEPGPWLWAFDTRGRLWSRRATTDPADWTQVGQRLDDGWPTVGDLRTLGVEGNRVLGIAGDTNKLHALVSVDPRNQVDAAMVVGDQDGLQLGSSRVFDGTDAAVRLRWPPESPTEEPPPAGVDVHVWPYTTDSTHVDVTIVPTGTRQVFRPLLDGLIRFEVTRGATATLRGIMPPRPRADIEVTTEADLPNAECTSRAQYARTRADGRIWVGVEEPRFSGRCQWKDLGVDAEGLWQVAIRNPRHSQMSHGAEIVRVPRALSVGFASTMTTFTVPTDHEPGDYQVALGPTHNEPPYRWGASNEVLLRVI